MIMADDAATRLYQAFVSQDPAAAISVVERVKKGGVAQDQLFDSLFAPAMSLLGGAWSTGAIDEITFTQAAVVAEQITSFVTPSATAPDTGVTVLIGAMHRDHHSMDKNIIGAALKEAGHRVIDLGVDVRPAEFLERAEESGARIVIVCATTIGTATDCGRVREMLATAGHDEALVLVAGGPFVADPTLARRVGANGVIRGAESAMKLVERIAHDRLGGER
jgi:methanogenic corrinoid protein MtbC1